MKKRRVIIMTALCLVGSLSGFSQLYQDFNLSEYITPDIVRNNPYYCRPGRGIPFTTIPQKISHHSR